MVMSLLTRPKKTVATIVIAADGSGDFNTDGVDDNVQIQAAIDSLPAGGGCIYIREGTYNITNQINITTNNVALIGCGRSTIITTTANITMFDLNGVIGCLIQKIYIYGAGAGNAANHGIYIRGVSSYCIINECWVENCGSVTAAIWVTSSDSVITNCYIQNNVDAIRIIGINFRIINNYIKDNVGIGIDIETNTGIVSENYLENNSFYNIVGRGRGILINNNVCISAGFGGIFLTAPEGGENYDNVVDGNYINGSVYNGISFNYTDKSIISNNTVFNNDVDNTATYNGIYLENSDENIISNNRCRENDRYEIYINAGSSKNIVEGNHCIGTDHEGTINDLGTNTQIFNNVES